MTPQEYATRHIEDNYDPINDLETAYSAYLDDEHPECKIAGLSYCTSDVLQQVDPTAYRCGFNDWLDSETSDGSIHEIAGKYWDREAGEKHAEILEALEEVKVYFVSAEDFMADKFSHSDLEEKPSRADYDTKEEYAEALSEWREDCESLEGWHWQGEDGELVGPFDTEEEAWEEAAGV